MTNRLTHKILLAAGIGMGSLLAATGAQAQTTVTVNPWYNNITVGAPLTHGVYGQIVLGVVVKFFWTRRSGGGVMHRRATGRQGWPAFHTARVIGSQVLNAIGYCYKS